MPRLQLLSNRVCETHWARVTPEIADEWRRKHNFANVQREIRPLHVTILSRLHHAGELDGRICIIDFATWGKHSVIINGNHTLEAIINTNKPLDTNVKYSKARSEDDAKRMYSVYDIQMKRTLADSLRAMGKVVEVPRRMVNGFGAAVKMYMMQFRGASALGPAAKRPGTLAVADASTEWIVEASEYGKWISRADGQVFHALTAGPYVAAGILTAREKPKEAEEFWTRVSTGENMRANDPRLRLHRYMCDRTGRVQLPNQKKLWVIAKAWEAFITGQFLDKPLHAPSDTPNNVRFVGTKYEKGLTTTLTEEYKKQSR